MMSRWFGHVYFVWRFYLFLALHIINEIVHSHLFLHHALLQQTIASQHGCSINSHFLLNIPFQIWVQKVEYKRYWPFELSCALGRSTPVLPHLSENGVDSTGLLLLPLCTTFSLAHLMQKPHHKNFFYRGWSHVLIMIGYHGFPFNFAPLNDCSRSGFSRMVCTSSSLLKNIKNCKTGRGFHALDIDLLGVILVLEWLLDGTFLQ